MNKLNQKVTNEKSSRDKNNRDDILVKSVTRLVQNPQSVISLLLIITAFFALQLPKLKFDYDFNSFFPKGDSELAFYDELNKDFGEYNNFLLITLMSDSITSPKVLTQIKSFSDGLTEWKEIERVESPFNQNRFQITPFGLNQVPLVTIRGISNAQIEERGLLGTFFGRDGKSLMIIIHHEAPESKEAGDDFYNKIQDHTDSSLPFKNIISGKTQMQNDFTNKLESEIGKLLGLAFTVIIICLLLIFKSTKGVIMPLVVLIITLIWMMGSISLMGKPLDIMAIVIPALLLIVSVSDVIHFVNKYDVQIKAGQSPLSSITEAIRSVGKATFLTSLTTAIGFASLVVIPIQPIRDFGLLTALGVLFAFTITILLIPSLLQLFPSAVQSSIGSFKQWQRVTDKLFIKVLRNSKALLVLLTIGSGILFYGMNDLRINTSLLVGLQKEEPELATIAYFDKNFDGYKPFEIGIELNVGDVWSHETLQKLDQLESFLTDLGVKQIASPLKLIKEINASIYGGARSQFKIPDSKDLVRIKRFYDSRRLIEEKSFFESDRFIRIIGRLPDSGSAATAPLYNKIESYLAAFNSDSKLKAKLTGTSYLIDKTDQYVVTSIMKGLTIGIGTVSLVLLIFFRSFTLLLISLLPNFLPVAIIAALMGWLNIDLNITTAIIFTITFGIAVDDTIHLIAKYQYERKSGRNHLWAIKRMLNHSGKSIIITSLILICGFTTFLLAGFSIPYYMGLLIVFSTLLALLYDLILLPIILASRKF